MTETIRILQYNIRGILSKQTQHYKCPRLYNLIKSRHIDIILLQEWCATVREDVAVTGTNSARGDHISVNKFPSGFFPDYHVHLHSTECAILYHKDLCVTPLNKPVFSPDPQKHTETLQICGIMLHVGSTDYAIYNVYKTGQANPCDIFKLQHQTDKVIICGDFNIHHPLWGSDSSSVLSNTFVEYLNNSSLKLLNKQTPTRVDPRNKTLSHIDLSLASLDIDNIKWSINQHNHNPKMSDHFHILLTLSIRHNPDESLYHNSWNLSSKSKWRHFQNLLTSQLNLTNPPTDTNNHATHINNTIYNTAIET